MNELYFSCIHGIIERDDIQVHPRIIEHPLGHLPPGAPAITEEPMDEDHERTVRGRLAFRAEMMDDAVAARAVPKPAGAGGVGKSTVMRRIAWRLDGRVQPVLDCIDKPRLLLG